MQHDLDFRSRVPPCPHYITGGDTHDLCVVCLGAEHPLPALEGSDCVHCRQLLSRTLFEKSA